MWIVRKRLSPDKKMPGIDRFDTKSPLCHFKFDLERRSLKSQNPLDRVFSFNFQINNITHWCKRFGTLTPAGYGTLVPSGGETHLRQRVELHDALYLSFCYLLRMIHFVSLSAALFVQRYDLPG